MIGPGILPPQVTVRAPALMVTVGPTIEVKASTGVRTTEAVQKMVANGATRIGTGSGIKIVTGGDDCKNCPTCTNCRKS